MSDGTRITTPSDGASDLPRSEPGACVPQVRLRLPAVPANVALARQALAGFADSLGVESARVADMKIALTEACTNAVVHAYGEEGGPLEVTMSGENGRLELIVRDRGHGLRPLPSAGDGPPLGFGLALIASLSDEFGVAGGRHGTEVRIAFSVGNEAEPASPLVVEAPGDGAWPPNDTTLELAPGEHAATVLSRVVSLVAARADFSIDRLSDAQIVSDAIAGAAGSHTSAGTLAVAIDECDRGFDLVIGPLTTGGARQLVADTELPGLGRLLERLTDALEVEPLDAPRAGERLRASLRERA